MRGCAGLKLSGAWARGVGEALARGWSNPQSLPRVAVPTGLFSIVCFGLRSRDCSILPNVCGHRRRLVRRTVERLVQLFHFVRSRCLSPENWCLGVENGVFFWFWGHFGVFLAILGRKTSTFSSFFSVTSHLREGVEVFGITPHLLNGSGHRRRLVRRTVERFVRRCPFPVFSMIESVQGMGVVFQTNSPRYPMLFHRRCV